MRGKQGSLVNNTPLGFIKSPNITYCAKKASLINGKLTLGKKVYNMLIKEPLSIDYIFVVRIISNRQPASILM